MSERTAPDRPTAEEQKIKVSALREGVILRIEMGLSHRQVAEALGKPSADA